MTDNTINPFDTRGLHDYEDPHADEVDAPAPLIVSAVELRAWARASQLLAEREGFHRTAKAVSDYIDLIELAMRSGAHSFELKPIRPEGN
jgi:hypothetical protein